MPERAVKMDGMLKLTTQNPLTFLVNFGMMAWNGTCAENCSGHGECHNGTCLCEIQFEGKECHVPNLSYYVAFATVFFLLALVCLIQLVMCIVAEWQRMKAPSLSKACRVTTQKLLYFLVFLAAIIRGAYFTSPAAFQEGWSSSLMSAYYALLLSGSSLIVCFWAEVFHLQNVRWEKPQFLSKSFLGFVTFNIITYSLLLAEFVTTQIANTSVEDKSFYNHVFNGCYAVLLFIVVIFFLIYGVEVFFKTLLEQYIRPGIVNREQNAFGASLLPAIEERDQFSEQVGKVLDLVCTAGQWCKGIAHLSGQVRGGFLSTHEAAVTSIAASNRTPEGERHNLNPAATKLFDTSNVPVLQPKIDMSQLHQSRVGLLSQALMLTIIVGFLFSETLSEFWKKKVPLYSRNWHDIVFRVVEIGVALWFPCVLWNCMSPEQLWILNPQKILRKLDLEPSQLGKDLVDETIPDGTEKIGDEASSSQDCWICYDNERQDVGPLIQPCQCRGDMSSVHHDCLRRWLVESSTNPDCLSCKVCGAAYQVERSNHLDWQHGFTTQHWLQTAAIVTCMCVSAAGAWVTIQLFEDPVIRMLAAGSALLIQYVCIRFLGLNTVVAYQRAKTSALNIVGGGHVATISETVAVDISKTAEQARI